MNKLFFTLALVISFTWASAQNTGMGQVPANKPKLNDQELNLTAKAKSLKEIFDARNAAKTPQSRWYNFAFSVDNILGNIATGSSNYFWPDSTALVNYSTGYSGTWIMGVADVFNPRSDWFEDAAEMEVNDVMPYTLDSVGFYCFYYRDPSLANAVDTLNFQFKVYTGTTSNYYWASSTSSWVQTNYGVDTILFKGIKHDPLKNTLSNDVAVVNVKYPLHNGDENDTLSNGLNYFVVPANVLVPINSVISTTVTFIPGFTWVPNVDTIDNLNRIRFVSYEENGDGGGSGTFPSYSHRDWNISYILPDSWMYNSASTVYAPSYAYTAGFAYEHHWIDYLVTADPNGIENNEVNAINLGQNHPNPFSGVTNINFILNENSNVTMTVNNITGSLVSEVNYGKMNAGVNTIKFDGSKLESGVYFYTIKAGNNSVTKKMIVE